MKTICLILLLTASKLAIGSSTIEWEGVASINYDSLSQKASQYISRSLPELANSEIKLIDINASYTFRHNHKNLHVLLMHSGSFIESGEERIVYENDIPKAILMNKLQYIFIDFDESGEPSKHRIEEVPFNGSKQDFMEEFSGF